MIRFALLLAVVSLPIVAHADLAPGPDFVESCTMEEQKKPNEICIKFDSSWFKPDAYAAVHKAEGYKYRCKTYGASFFSEIWCRSEVAVKQSPKLGTAASTPESVETMPAEKNQGCQGCQGVSHDAPAGVLWWLMLPLAYLKVRSKARTTAV